MNGAGAIAVIFTAIDFENGSYVSVPLGALGRMVSEAHSACHTEVLALDLAINTLLNTKP